MYRSLIKKFIYTVSILAISSCANVDNVAESTLNNSKSIVYRVKGVESETKAYLVDNSNVVSMFPDMTVKGVVNNTVKFTESFKTSTTEAISLTQGWDEDSYTFYSYPKDEIIPSFNNNAMSFDYTVSNNSTGTPDLIVARTEQSRGNDVDLTYKHIFTGVNLIYKKVTIGHTIKKIAVKNAYRSGKCTVSSSGVAWSNTSNRGDLVDTETRYATINNTTVTEDGYKFMIIPNTKSDDSFTIEVLIDSLTLTKTFTGVTKPGEILNFYIEDNIEIKKEDGSSASAEIKENPDGTYKMTMETYVTGEFKKDTVYKPMDFIMVLDYSESMDASYSESGYPTYLGATVTTHTYGEWKKNKSGYKVTFNGTSYTVDCLDIANSGTSNIHWAFITVGSDRYYITLDGGFYKSTNKSPTLANPPKSTDGHYIFPSIGEACPLWGVVTYSNMNLDERIDGLKKGVGVFVDEIAKQAKNHNINHRITLVSFQNNKFPSFNGKDAGHQRYLNSSSIEYLFQCYSMNMGSYSGLGNNTQTSAILYPFRSISEPNTDNSVKGAMALVPMLGSTALDHGLYLATLQMNRTRRVLNGEDVGVTAIVFTDGAPTSYTVNMYNVIPGYKASGTSVSSNDNGNGAISFAKKMKDQGAYVFSVSCCSGSDKPSNNLMNGLSSNYPKATSMTSLGEGGDKGYYIDASTTGLTKAFEKISQSVTEISMTINEKAYVKSIISDAFLLPANYPTSSDDITFYEIKQTGYDATNKKIIWSQDSTRLYAPTDIQYEIDTQNQSVIIRGFDYGKKYCTTKAEGPFTGSKLVMVFNNLPVNPEKIGTGDNLAIEYTTGLYNQDGSPVSMFDPIHVNL